MTVNLKAVDRIAVDGYVFEKVARVGDAGFERLRGKGGDYVVAGEPLIFDGREYQPGEELPAPARFAPSVTVTARLEQSEPGYDELAERGLIKRKRRRAR